MPPSPRTSSAPSRLQLAAAIAFLILLALAGGASRADVLGQTVVRAAAWAILVVAVVGQWEMGWRSAGPVGWILLVCVGLPLMQIIPLPPVFWLELPGRDLFSAAAFASNQDQPWRPISISPGATYNALGSLVVPLVMLLLALRLRSREQNLILRLIVGLVFVLSLAATLQISGARVDNPFVNDVPGAVSGLLANRNHFALFVAIGMCLTPSAIMRGRGRSFARLALTVGVITFFALVILATGSRAGLALGAIGLILGLAVGWRSLIDQASGISRFKVALIFGAAIGSLALLVALSLYLGKAVAIDRTFAMDVGADARARALPVISTMIERYFPVGSGFGAFDPVFRISEPAAQLGPLYMNHAHNDWIEVVLDGGLLALVALALAVAWWGWRSISVWRREDIRARLGSSVILLILLASLVDYPARTPLIMSLLVIGAVWLQTDRPDSESD